jgi:hypothetical protein
MKLFRRSQPGQKGVLLRRIEPTLPVCKQLRKGDVMLSFDGTQIGNDGTVAFRSGERINFSYLVSEKQNHEDVRAGNPGRMHTLTPGRAIFVGIPRT